MPAVSSDRQPGLGQRADKLPAQKTSAGTEPAALATPTRRTIGANCRNGISRRRSSISDRRGSSPGSCISKPGAAAARRQRHHQTRMLGGAAEALDSQREGAVPAVRHPAPHRLRGEDRLPDQRAVGEDPDRRPGQPVEQAIRLGGELVVGRMKCAAGGSSGTTRKARATSSGVSAIRRRAGAKSAGIVTGSCTWARRLAARRHAVNTTTRQETARAGAPRRAVGLSERRRSGGDAAAEHLVDVLLRLELLDAVDGGDLAGQPLERRLVELALGIATARAGRRCGAGRARPRRSRSGRRN